MSNSASPVPASGELDDAYAEFTAWVINQADGGEGLKLFGNYRRAYRASVERGAAARVRAAGEAYFAEALDDSYPVSRGMLDAADLIDPEME